MSVSSQDIDKVSRRTVLLLDPSFQIGQRQCAVRDLVLLGLVHLGVCSTLVFENRIPTYGTPLVSNVEDSPLESI